MLRYVLVAVALCGAAACQKSGARSSEADKTATKPADPAPLSPAGAAPAGDIEARVARLERRVEKIVTLLDQAMGPSEPDPALTYSVPVNPEDPVEGPADAKVTVVEAYEFACPYCWKVAPTMDALLAKYPKDVRIVSKYLLIHGAPALPPALAACAAARQGKYTPMKKLLWSKLFSADGQLQQDKLAAENMEKFAAEAGLDLNKFKSDFNGQVCKDWVKKSQESLQPVGTSGTPSFYINGRHLNGAVPQSEFERVINEEKAKADKALASGIKAKDYYETAVVQKGEKKVKSRFED